MEREIVLTSYENKSGKNKPSDFTTKFVKPITLDNNREYVIGHYKYVFYLVQC